MKQLARLFALISLSLLMPLHSVAADFELVSGEDYELSGGICTLNSRRALCALIDYSAAVASNPDSEDPFPEAVSFALGRDIDFTSLGTSEVSDARGTLLRSLDGRGFKIQLNGTMPLFDSVGSQDISNVVVKNLELAVAMEVTCDAFTGQDLGVLCNTNYGTITNCLVNGTVSVDMTALDMTGNLSIGGLCGGNASSGAIAAVAAGVSFSLVYASGTSVSGVNVGSVCGQNIGTMTDCVALPCQFRLGEGGKGTYTPFDNGRVLSIEGGSEFRIVNWGACVGAAQGTENNLFYVDGLLDMAPAADQASLSESVCDFKNSKATALSNKTVDTSSLFVVDGMTAYEAFNQAAAWHMVTTPDATVQLPLPTLADIPEQLRLQVESAGNDKRVLMTGSDEASVSAIFARLAEGGLMRTAHVSITEPVTFHKPDIDLHFPDSGQRDDLDHDKLTAALPTLPLVENFAGILDANKLTGLAVCSQGLFATLDEGAQVNGLLLEDATIYVDPTKCDADEQNVYVPILANEMKGNASALFGFAGNVVVDPTRIPKTTGRQDKTLNLALVNKFNEANSAINGFLFVANTKQPAEGNKICITIKQNLGTGRNKPNGGYNPPKQKVATNGKPAVATKGLSVDEYAAAAAADRNELTRVFTDEAFADGSVAYWLNWSGATVNGAFDGYAGSYTPRWSQGPQQPIPAIVNNGNVVNALQKVEYQIRQGNDAGGEQLITSNPVYCNDAGSIRLTYTKKPVSISNGAAMLIKMDDTSATWAYDASAPVVVQFAASSALAPTTASEAEPAQVTYYDLRGRRVEAGAQGLLIEVTSLCNGKTRSRLVRQRGE